LTIAERFDEKYKIDKDVYKNFFRVLDLSNDTDQKLFISAFLHVPFIAVDTDEATIYDTKDLVRDFWENNLEEYANSLMSVSNIPRNKCKTFLKMMTNNFIVFPDLSINLTVQKVQKLAEQKNKSFMDAYMVLIGE